MILFFKLLIFLIGDILLEEIFIPRLEYRDGVTYLEKNNIFRKIVQFIILVATTFNYGVSEIVIAAIKSDTYFIYISSYSCLLAISTIVAGIFESKIMVSKYIKGKVDKKSLSNDDRRRIAKLGGEQYIPGRGVYDYSFKFMFYAGMCNILGTLTVLSIIYYVREIPMYLNYLLSLNNSWANVLEFIAPITMYACLMHTYNQQVQSKNIKAEMFEQNLDIENPSVYSFKRFHVHFNMLHFWYTLTMVLFLLSTYMGFVLKYSREIVLRPTLLFPIVFAILFIVYSGASPYAKKINAVSRDIVVTATFCVFLVALFLVYNHFIKASIDLLIFLICLILSVMVLGRGKVGQKLDIPTVISMGIIVLILVLYFCN